jgi:hypothetical protein
LERLFAGLSVLAVDYGGDGEHGDWGRLLELIAPPAWYARAACRTVPTAAFFNPSKRVERLAIAVCACVVFGGLTRGARTGLLRD